MTTSSFNPHGARSGPPVPPPPSRAGADPRVVDAVVNAVGADRMPPRSGSLLPWPELTWPWLAGGVLLGVIAVLEVDFRLAGWLYALEGDRWALRFAFVTNELVHRMGRNLSTAAWLAVVVAWALTWWRQGRKELRRPLAMLALSVLLATSLVAWIKSWSNIDCPYDLLQFGGQRPFFGLLDARPADLGHPRCFPAGHASAGFAWMALYFFFLQVRPTWRWAGLAVGLGAGALFGVTQQLRGAHFLSHDIWAALLCWTVAVVVWRVAGRPGAQA